MRVVIDTLAELRLLCEDEIECRRQFLALRKALEKGTRTVIITDYVTEATAELRMEALSQGTIHLERVSQGFGKARRRLNVVKYRGMDVQSDWLDFVIRKGGIEVYPAIVAAEHREEC